MKVIVPCCGRSSRFPNLPPKWMLPSHDGRPMICLALADLKFDLDDLIVTYLAEHEASFQTARALAEAFGRPIRTCILPNPTRSQADTVAKTLQTLSLAEPFFVKDADNSFTAADLQAAEGYVCVDSLNDYDDINARSKSYVRCDDAGSITEIREKQVISDTFNVGGYYFPSPSQFLEYFGRLAKSWTEGNREIYLSDVIGAMLGDGVRFRARKVTNYCDWGTLREWRRSLRAKRAYFVLLDGFVFERGGEFFAPRFADVRPQPAAAAEVRRLAALGHHLVYLTIRPETYAELTQQQLAAADLPEAQIVFDCPIARWMLVTAPDPTLPFASCGCIEVRPDDVNLPKLLEDGDV